MQLFLADDSVDAIVTDPPYELTAARPGGRSEATRGKVMRGFMGMQWDGSGVAFDVDTWRQALRVLKPGGHLLAFGGTRTYHRMACAIEDAGFEVRDQIGWLYGSGFPKSHNGEWGGTALKPAWEPIIVARKPLIGTVEANWLTYGTGALNIDGCRVPGEKPDTTRGASSKASSMVGTLGAQGRVVDDGLGRWPANIIHDSSDEVIAAFPQAPGQQGDLTGQSEGRKSRGIFGDMPPAREHAARQDVDKSAARFFYCAKASQKDRNDGCEHLARHSTTAPRANYHPTVKPTELMRYLCRLVTPKGGLVLDPFAGSGSTGKACKLESLQFVGFELSEEYATIANARIAAA